VWRQGSCFNCSLAKPQKSRTALRAFERLATEGHHSVNLLRISAAGGDCVIQDQLVFTRGDEPVLTVREGRVASRASAHLDPEPFGENSGGPAKRSMISYQQQRTARLHPITHGVALIVGKRRMSGFRIIHILGAQRISDDENFECLERFLAEDLSTGHHLV